MVMTGEDVFKRFEKILVDYEEENNIKEMTTLDVFSGIGKKFDEEGKKLKKAVLNELIDSFLDKINKIKKENGLDEGEKIKTVNEVKPWDIITDLEEKKQENIEISKEKEAEKKEHFLAMINPMFQMKSGYMVKAILNYARENIEFTKSELELNLDYLKPKFKKESSYIFDVAMKLNAMHKAGLFDKIGPGEYRINETSADYYKYL
jgi:uncharacterized protein YjgD (DUF1641 family)